MLIMMRMLGLVVAFVAAGGLVSCAGFDRPQPGTVPVDDDDIGGVVTGPKGPEAGVWGIAETLDAMIGRRAAMASSSGMPKPS